MDKESMMWHMLNNGGYEQLTQSELEAKQRKALFVNELQSKVNACSRCGSRQIGINVHQDKDGCASNCYCLICGKASKPVYESDATPESLKKIFQQWHNDNNDTDVIITAPLAVAAIKELGEMLRQVESLEDFNLPGIFNRVIALEKWSGLRK